MNAQLISALVVASSISLTTLAIAAPNTQRSEGLFDAAHVATNQAALRANAIPGKARGVKVDRRLLGKGRMRLNLGVGPDLEVIRERVVEHRNGRAWIGRVAGDETGSAIFAISGDAVAGTIKHNGRMYLLEPAGKGRQRLAEVSPSDPLPSTEAVADVLGDGSTRTTAAATASTGATIVDVLVAYTPESLARYGSADGVEAVITLAIEETNQAYLNSDAPVELRLVGTIETSHHDTGDMNDELVKLTVPGDGDLDDVIAERDNVGADLVSLLVDSGNYCGLSWQMAVMDPQYAAYGFSVVNTLCATGYYSLGHEIGHNLGLSHDVANATSALFPYSYGYQDPASAFRTIMAYNCDTGCVRVQHFSNPEVSYGGSPTGVAGAADNALALVDTAPLVATWRASVVPFPPMAPSDLTAATLSYDRIDLDWIDQAADEDGFQVERSENGVDFSLIATLPADATTFADQALVPETTYTYRVSAFNGAGASDPSNDAWATTDPAPVPVPAAPSDLAATALSHTEIALTWSDNAADETGYELERSTDGGASWSLLASLGSNAAGYSDQGLSPSTAYAYRVRATGAGDPSDYSAVASATTDPEPVYPPADPSGLTAQALSESEIALSWTDNAADETGYDVERSTDGGLSWALIATLGADAGGLTDTGLAAATYYLYRVRAYGDGGPSGYSNESGATTQAPAPECSVEGAPSISLGDRDMQWQLTNTGGNPVTISRVQLSWPSSQGDLKKISLSGSLIWVGSDAPFSADISGGWSDPGALVLGAGQTGTLDFDFKRRDKNDSQSDYSITVDFAEGCSVQF